MTKSTSVWVASDSTNQPVWNSASEAWKTHSSTPEREEVVERADGPDHQHEPPDEPDVPALRAPDVGVVDVVGGDGDLGEIVEEVVQQDLRRQHRQERQEERRAPAMLNMLPKFELVPISRYFMTLPKAAPPLEDAVVQHAQAALEQDDVGGVLGHVDRARDRDADVGGVQRRARR